MAAAASQLCVRQASTLLDCFIHHKGCKIAQISPLFHLYLYLSFKFRRASILFYANLACQVLYRYTTQISIYTEYGSRLMAKEEKSTFQISSLLIKFIYFKYVYTRERLLLAKSAKQSEGKGVSRSQLQCQATTALRKNSVHPNRAGVIEINVCEHQRR